MTNWNHSSKKIWHKNRFNYKCKKACSGHISADSIVDMMLDDNQLADVSCMIQVREELNKDEISSKWRNTIFELNDGNAAKELYEQLPLRIDVEDFSNNEKIFYPPKKLETTNTPLANAEAGTLAYYAPWGDVVMFYEKFGSAGGLYELGNVVSGGEYIKNMSGTILIEKV